MGRGIDFNDIVHLRRVSHLLDRYEELSSERVVFRCPYCGDSRSSKWRRRGVILSADDGSSVFSCKNCGESKPFWKFLMDQDRSVHRSYSMDKFRSRPAEDKVSDEDKAVDDAGADARDAWRSVISDEPQKASAVKDTSLFEYMTGGEEAVEEVKTVQRRSHIGTSALNKLSMAHPAIEYLNKRKLTRENTPILYDECRWTDDYVEWNNEHGRTEIKNRNIEGRIIIPLLWHDGTELGVQARLVSGNARTKYISTQYEDAPLVAYGFDRADITQEITVVEGCFDSLGVKNGVACLGSDLGGFVDRVIAVRPELRKEQFRLIFDNEPANRQIVQLAAKAVDAGLAIAFWNRPQHDIGKDIAEIVFENGHDVEEYLTTCRGLQARLRMSRWTNRL